MGVRVRNRARWLSLPSSSSIPCLIDVVGVVVADNREAYSASQELFWGQWGWSGRVSPRLSVEPPTNAGQAKRATFRMHGLDRTRLEEESLIRCTV